MTKLQMTITTETDGEWTPITDSPLSVTVDGPTDPASLTSRAIVAARFYRDQTGHVGNVYAGLRSSDTAGHGYALTVTPTDFTSLWIMTKARGAGVVLIDGEELDWSRAADTLTHLGLLAREPDAYVEGQWIRRYVLTGPYEADFAVHLDRGAGWEPAPTVGRRRLVDATQAAVDQVADAIAATAATAGGCLARATVYLVTDDGRHIESAGEAGQKVVVSSRSRRRRRLVIA